MVHKFYLGDMKNFDIDVSHRLISYTVPIWDAPTSNFILHIYEHPNMHKGFIYDVHVVGSTKTSDGTHYKLRYDTVRFSNTIDSRKAKLENYLETL